MSFQAPAYRIRRRTVVGMEGMHSKMFDPPTESPDTPDLVIATNPVPEVMGAAGFLSRNPPSPLRTVQRQLMHGMMLPTWDGQDMMFFLFRDPDGVGAAKDGTYPAPTIRMPRGVIFHCETAGSGPPPHTIHWHGFEPTPMNDGVGHCSFEVGQYTYQFQPNFIGSYFHHCHRNTMQHFEFGLYGFNIIDPSDAFFASIAGFREDGSVILNATPIGNGRPEAGFPLGRRRTAANLSPAINSAFSIFGQDNFNLLTDPDPEAGNANLPVWLKFDTDPHAHTVPYDVEALWVVDDRDMRWSMLADGAKDTFPAEGSIPGTNDNFYGNAGSSISEGDFFAFNDFRSTHFYVTGVPVPDDTGSLRYPGAMDPGTIDAPGAGEIGHGIVIPPELMSGVSGVQVSINAALNQNILLRVLNAAYNNVRVTFPVDVVIIAWDGRALGVPPYGNYNEPVVVKAGTSMEWSVARRFDCMMRSSVPVNSFATVKFVDTLRRDVRFTARIPINIGAGQDVLTFAVSGKVTDALGGPLAGVTVTTAAQSLGGSPAQTTVTDALGNYTVSGLAAGTYLITPTLAGVAFDPASSMVTLTTDGATNIDFTVLPVAAPTFSVLGDVSLGGVGLPGVTMGLSGISSATATTDLSGNYRFDGLAAGSYTVTPSLAGFTFTPQSAPAVVPIFDSTTDPPTALPTNTVPTFIASVVVVPTFAVSGSVVNQGGTPLAGVAMSVIGPVNATAVTDASGNYSVAGLPDGAYTLTPSLSGFAFSPPSRSLTIAGADVTVPSFVGAPAVAEVISVTTATVQTSGNQVSRLGPRWDVRGVGTPGKEISIFLGPTLTGEPIGSTTVDRKGSWKFNDRAVVQLPITATSISVSSSGGGVVLDQPLTVK